MNKFKESTLGGIVILTVICLIVAGVLAVTNKYTKDIITENQLFAANKSLSEIFPDGKDFSPLDIPRVEGITDSFKVDDGAGYIFQVAQQGFGGEVSFLIGVDSEGKIVGVKMLPNHNETEGMGDRVGEAEYLDTLVGKSGAGDIDTLSGATVTSNALKKGVALATEGFSLATGKEIDTESDTGAEAGEGSDTGAGATETSAVEDGIMDPALVLAGTKLTAMYGSYPAGVERVYKADNGKGYVFAVNTKGFGGEVGVLVALDEAGQIMGLALPEGFNKETDGIGSKVAESAYLDQFIGKTSGEGVDAKAGATVTSDAVKQAIDISVGSLETAKSAKPLPEQAVQPTEEAAGGRDLTQLLPNISGLEKIELVLPTGVQAAYKVADNAGFVFDVVADGFGGEMNFVVILDNNGMIQDIMLISHKETEGIGSKVGDAQFLAGLIGKAPGEVTDTVAGATVSSEALLDALAKSAESYNLVRNG